MLDFEAAPAQPVDATLIPSLKHAAGGGDCKTTYISSIASLAQTNINMPYMPTDLVNESKTIMSAIQQYYDVAYANGFITITKKGL